LLDKASLNETVAMVVNGVWAGLVKETISIIPVASS